jgi:hypothetical protein
MERRHTGDTRRFGRLRRLALSLAVLVLLSLVADRLFPLVGVPIQRPTRLTLPPNLSIRRERLEFTWTLETNSLGLRGPSAPPARPQGVRRILLLGDEQTVGVGVETDRTFAAQLQERLDRSRVINAGRPGINTLTQARIFRHVGLRLHPDLVLFCVAADDVADMSGKPVDDPLHMEPRGFQLTAWLWPNIGAMWEASQQRADYIRLPEPRDFVERITDKARRNKALVAADIDRWRRTVADFPAVLRAAQRCPADGDLFARALLWRNRWSDCLDLDGWHWANKWEPLRDILAACVREADRRKVRVAVAFLPARIQYDPAHLAFLRRLGYYVRRRWLAESSRFQIELGRWCGDRTVPFYDLTGPFRERAAQTELQYPYAETLTPAGHRLVARELAPWLRRQLETETGRDRRRRAAPAAHRTF